jgi:hypothetical protein
MWRPIKTSVRAAAKRAPEQEKYPETSPVLPKLNLTCFHDKPDFARKYKTESLFVLLWYR